MMEYSLTGQEMPWKASLSRRYPSPFIQFISLLPAYAYFCSHMRKIAFVFTLLSTTAAYAQQPPELWDLRRCADFAVTNNISVRQSVVQQRLSELIYLQSKDSRWPSANLSLSYGMQNGRSIDPTTNQFISQQVGVLNPNIQSGVTLFNFGSVKNTIAANRLTLEADRQQTEKVKTDIQLNVANAYLQALLAYEQIAVAEVTVAQTKEQLNITRKRVDAGGLPELNALELEAQLATDSSTLMVNQNNYQLNLLQLKALLNLDAAMPFDIAKPPVELIPVEPLSELQPGVVYDLAVVNQPLQKANQFRFDAAKKTTQATKAQMYPTLSAFGSLQSSFSTSNKLPAGAPIVTFTPSPAYIDVGGTSYFVQSPSVRYNDYKTVRTFNQLSDNFRQSLGVTIQVPIFNGNQAKTNWKRAKLNETNISLQMMADSQALKQNIYQAYQSALSSLQVFNSRTKAVDLANRSYDLGKKRYDLGLLPTLDLIILQNNLQRAKIDALSSQFEYVFRLKVLEFYKGNGIKL